MPLYNGPISDHFDGQHFFNPRVGAMHGTGSALKWLLTRRPASWRKWIDAPPGATPPERIDDGKIRVTFVGHSTVLIQLEGLNILCDPIWSHRASPLSFIGPPRHRAPGIHFDQLPTIDLVLQSHDHYDHFDLPTLRRIAARWRPDFAVPLGVRARLTAPGIAPLPPPIFQGAPSRTATKLSGAATLSKALPAQFISPETPPTARISPPSASASRKSASPSSPSAPIAPNGS